MGFMQPEITDKERWAEVETNCGTEWVPIEQLGITLPPFDENPANRRRCESLLRDYLEGDRIYNLAIREGYGARLSAPGYLDCTEWAVFDTEQEARDYLEEMYGEEDNQ
jgi:hypothetical protein